MKTIAMFKIVNCRVIQKLQVTIRRNSKSVN